mmetsp:Transcript_28692/g.32902  ORF Transcript_28692/g.32902 Transcript_28692/m.32902 type:complete len:483 (+) Transcript_28692:292-1740(+)
MIPNWCEICQEACSQHPTICSVCGTTLTMRTPTASTNDDSITTTDTTNERLLNDMRHASRDLHHILGNLRGQVQDLDNLTRDILQQQEDGNLGLPPEAWDPHHSTSGPSSRPTSKKILNKIPRFILNNKSTLFRQAKLQINSNLTPNDGTSTVASIMSTIPAAFECTENDSVRITTENHINFDCVVGEFGPVEEYMFNMEALVHASPLTGKGGLSEETKTQITYLRQNSSQRPTDDNGDNKTKSVGIGTASAAKVVLFMGRGDGLTFVQKVLMAQEAGAAAVIIGNNTSTPWPYVMKDSKGEAEKNGRVFIPVVMIKEVNAQQILRMFEKQKQMVLELEKRKQSTSPLPIPKQIIITKEKSTGQQQTPPRCSQIQQKQRQQPNRHNCHLLCNLQIATQSSDCAVCCEQLENSEKVLVVPGCGHIFHEACALAWLQSHNTCPYCRKELPTDDPEYERERRLRQQRTNSTTRESTNSNVDAYYG